MKNLKIGTKIIGMVVIILVMAVISNGLGMIKIGNLGDEINRIVEADIPLIEMITKMRVNQLEQAIWFERALRFGQVMASNEAAREKLKHAEEEFEILTTAIDEKLRKGEELVKHAARASKTTESRAEFEEIDARLKIIDEHYADYEQLAHQIFALIDKEELHKAAALAESVEKAEEKLDHELKQLLKDIEKFAEEAALTAGYDEQAAITGMSIISFFSIIFGLFAGIFMTRAIRRPLLNAVDVCNELSKGDLTGNVEAKSQDEIGQMLLAMKDMIAEIKKKNEQLNEIAVGNLSPEVAVSSEKDQMGLTIQKIVIDLRSMAAAAKEMALGNLDSDIKTRSEKDELGMAFEMMTTNLRKMVSELIEGTNSISSSVAQLSTTISELSSSTAETATSLSEVTTTVEEVRQAAQISSEKAGQVSDFAEAAARNSEEGKKATDESVAGMQQIKVEMDYIAESIMKLSEQTQSIGDIINAVNDLADQSNLLSVNASIEAAKAGEQGKGFGVVAQEVKSLADQSKEATAQVRNILSDIQKATGSAVMATERGSKAVESGVRLAILAGDIIRNLSDNIAESADSAVQIAASSQEQLIGIDQLATAMENIKDAGTQNTEGARQLEQATRGIEELGGKLKEITERFRL